MKMTMDIDPTKIKRFRELQPLYSKGKLMDDQIQELRTLTKSLTKEEFYLCLGFVLGKSEDVIENGI